MPITPGNEQEVVGVKVIPAASCPLGRVAFFFDFPLEPLSHREFSTYF
jgi:hypothetical protein